MRSQDTYTETEVITKLKAKDTEVFPYLYEKYSKCLYAIILHIIPDRELASDILQEAFVTIWYKGEHYDSTKGKLFTWMLQITRNLSIDMLRSKGYRNSLKVRESREEDGETFFDIPAELVTDGVDDEGLATAVHLLSPQYRNLIQLVYFQGYTQAEVALMQGIPLGTIKTRMRAALSQLREFMVNMPAEHTRLNPDEVGKAKKRKANGHSPKNLN